MIFLNPAKIAFSCRVSISTCRVMLQVLSKVSLDSNEHFTYVWRACKMRRKDSTSQNRDLVKVWKELFLTFEIGFWLCQPMIFLNPTKIFFAGCRPNCKSCSNVLNFFRTLPHTLTCYQLKAFVIILILTFSGVKKVPDPPPNCWFWSSTL